MSFASEVKKELLNVQTNDCCKKALAQAILQSSSSIALSNTGPKIIIKTHISAVIRFIKPYIEEKYHTSYTVLIVTRNSINSKKQYCIEITDIAKDLIRDFNLLPGDELLLSSDLFKNECCKQAYVRGIFICKGSISDPRKKNYHLEIQHSRYDIIKLIVKLLKQKSIEAKVYERNNSFVLYIKKSQEITSFMAFIEATSGVFYFEDIRIERDLKNSINRVINCDIANGNRSMAVAKKHMEAIEYLEAINAVESLSVRLQDAILLRKAYPEANLAELSEYSSEILGKEISKSGVSHLMNDILKAATKYRGE